MSGRVHFINPSFLVLMSSVNDEDEVLAKVSDFGLSSTADIQYTRLVSNPVWLAPEVIRGMLF